VRRDAAPCVKGGAGSGVVPVADEEDTADVDGRELDVAAEARRVGAWLDIGAACYGRVMGGGRC
jgi:hypothetical protein